MTTSLPSRPRMAILEFTDRHTEAFSASETLSTASYRADMPDSGACAIARKNINGQKYSRNDR